MRAAVLVALIAASLFASHSADGGLLGEVKKATKVFTEPPRGLPDPAKPIREKIEKNEPSPDQVIAAGKFASQAQGPLSEGDEGGGDSDGDGESDETKEPSEVLDAPLVEKYSWIVPAFEWTQDNWPTDFFRLGNAHEDKRFEAGSSVGTIFGVAPAPDTKAAQPPTPGPVRPTR